MIQTTHDAENPLNNQYQQNEVILVTVNENTYLLQKSHLNNTNNVGLATGYAEFFSFFNAQDNQTEVRIKPYETFSITDYDIKAFSKDLRLMLTSDPQTLAILSTPLSMLL